MTSDLLARIAAYVKSAEGWKGTWKFVPAHTVDHGVGTVSDYVSVPDRVVYFDEDGEETHVEFDGLDTHVLEAMADLLNAGCAWRVERAHVESSVKEAAWTRAFYAPRLERIEKLMREESVDPLRTRFFAVLANGKPASLGQDYGNTIEAQLEEVSMSRDYWRERAEELDDEVQRLRFYVPSGERD